MKELSLYDNRGPSNQPVNIVAEFLAYIKAYLIKNLDIQYGKGLWKTLRITLVVTVPAVWSNSLKNSTLQAVNKASFNDTELPQLKRTILTTKSEAAAIYTFNHFAEAFKMSSLLWAMALLSVIWVEAQWICM